MPRSSDTDALPDAVGCLCSDPRGRRDEDLPCDLRDEEETQRFLLRQAGRRVVAADAVISKGGVSERRCFRVMEGVARLVLIDVDGRRQVTRFAFPGDYFGLSRSERELVAEAASHAVLLEFDAGRLQRLSDCNPHLARQLATAMRSNLGQAMEHVVLLGRKTPRQRLAGFLRMLHRQLGLGDVVPVPMPRTDIADYVGLTPETVSRAFADLRQRKVVDHIDRNLLRVDLPALVMIADGGA
ncbi:MAG: Crp/Fnr family transcriptional regulator [Methylobacterium sp.]|jgi:CRP-like cAMP-binding protein|uniref:Crp/Fnr family transcriptional regulator n=1 Tax=Methylobacterium sp. TaxID=409 RepID=UPI00258BB0D1|nr:Crp/Fnr family transcriptional regulator [Methylobacterium sp.]MBY0298713.1 Crp/Fnr family transcriptional regulator [Methylobacterium sp.]